MRSPVIAVCAFDDWLANQLRSIAAERKWTLQETRQLRALHREEVANRPSVIILQVDCTQSPEAAAEVIRRMRQQLVDTAIVVVNDTKVTEEDRAGWTAAWHHLGASYVLYPPLTRPVIEDLVCGLMDAIIARATAVGAKS